MIMKRILILLALSSVIFSVSTEELNINNDVKIPSEFLVCNYELIDDCLKENLQKFFPYIKNGLPNLNIPSIDPYIVDNMNIEYKRRNIYGFLSVKHCEVFGLSDAIFKSVKTRETKKGLDANLVILVKKMILNGTYEGEGKFGVFSMKPKGNFNILITNVTITYKAVNFFETRGNETYLRIHKFDAIPTKIGNLEFDATGLFPDPELNRLALDFLKQHWQSMYRLILPEAQNQWGPTLKDLLNGMLTNIPYRDLLPQKSNKQ